MSGRPLRAGGTTTIFPLRLTDAERKALEAEAQRQGTSVAEVIRGRLTGLPGWPGLADPSARMEA